MLIKVPATKVGMTQIFDEKRRVIPVTVVDFSHWFVTQIKTEKNDGYQALQVGHLKNRYHNLSFDPAWLKRPATYFDHRREVTIAAGVDIATYKLGQALDLDGSAIEEGILVDVTGTSTGKGFQGVVKRWDFAGGPKSHGSGFHRRPGSIGNMATQGEVLKGTKLPGHCGFRTITTQGLRVIKRDTKTGHLFLKGATPGKKNSLLLIRKQGS